MILTPFEDLLADRKTGHKDALGLLYLNVDLSRGRTPCQIVLRVFRRGGCNITQRQPVVFLRIFEGPVSPSRHADRVVRFGCVFDGV